MKTRVISLSNNDLILLKKRYNIDLTEPSSLKAFKEATRETSKRIREIQLEIFNQLYPHRKKRIPNGLACSFCLRRENEVTAMAKHESGFNLCHECHKSLHSDEQE